MNDYLRTRIDALTREVSRLELKIENLEAIIEVYQNNKKTETQC